MNGPPDDKDLAYRLGERVKELKALHRSLRILQDEEGGPKELMAEIVRLLPGAWQHPECAEARIRFGDIEVSTPGFTMTRWVQTALFSTRNGDAGRIDLCYLAELPGEFEGPFLAEERELIDSLAEMLRSYFQRRISLEAIDRARGDLEAAVACRTAELSRANRALEEQVEAHQAAQRRIEQYQRQLRRMSSQLSLTEARERRTIASDLHDNLGQALAFIRVRIAEFRGNAMFCGFEEGLGEIQRLLDQAIRYTRDLTFEISPPILYDLGLEDALDWLTEHFLKKHGLKVVLKVSGPERSVEEDVKVTCFKSIREVLTNTVKHSGANEARILVDRSEDRLRVVVEDRGAGFDPAELDASLSRHQTFGLFSIRERLRSLGGEVIIEAAPREGTRITLLLPYSAEEAS